MYVVETRDMSFERSCMQQRVNYVVDSFSRIPRLTLVTMSAYLCVCVRVHAID